MPQNFSIRDGVLMAGEPAAGVTAVSIQSRAGTVRVLSIKFALRKRDLSAAPLERSRTPLITGERRISRAAF